VPAATRFGVFYTPTAPPHVPLLQVAETVGAKIQVTMYKMPVQSVDDFDAAFATMARKQALCTDPDPRPPLFGLANKYKLNPIDTGIARLMHKIPTRYPIPLS
jgi:hypothetical protein